MSVNNNSFIYLYVLPFFSLLQLLLVQVLLQTLIITVLFLAIRMKTSMI